jgi:hypothetical protein
MTIKLCATLVLLVAIPLVGATAAELTQQTLFDSTTATAADAGQGGHFNVVSWQLGGPKNATHDIPLRGFYVAHLLTGAVATTIDGVTTTQPPDAYWTIKAGATMQVKVLSEFAVLETIVAAKP